MLRQRETFSKNSMQIRHNVYLFTIFLLLSSFTQGHARDLPEGQEVRTEVILGVDKVKRLDFNPHTRVEIGNPQILNYRIAPQRREITLQGLNAGNTSVIVREEGTGDIRARYLVTVTATDQSRLVQELRDKIGDVEGIEIGIKGGDVYVGGHIVVPNDIGRVAVVLEPYQRDVLILVELSPHTQRVIAQRMQEEIQNAGMRDVTVRVVNGLFWLEGVVTSNARKALAETKANALIPDQIESLARRTDSVARAQRAAMVHNFISVNPQSQPTPLPRMVKITVQFVELTRNYSRIFGFSWNPLLTGTGGEINIGRTGGGDVQSRSRGTLAATISNLFPKLASARDAGYARVIQSGVIVIKDGVTGNLSKETEIPFGLGSGDFLRAETATAGFSLEVTPQILQEEQIDLNLGIDVAASVGDPPQTTKNSVATNLMVRSSESAVVGGIAVNKTSTDYDKDPPFGTPSFEESTPLFSFLRSKAHRSERSQFVVFITPEIIQSASEGTAEVMQKFRQRGR